MPYFYNDFEYATQAEAEEDALKEMDSSDITDHLLMCGFCVSDIVETFVHFNDSRIKDAPQKFFDWMRDRVNEAVEDYLDGCVYGDED